MANEVEISIIAIDSASDILEKIADKFGVLGEIAAGAIGVAAGALGTLITKGAESEDVFARFNSLLSSSPLAPYKQQLLDLAEALSKTTRFEHENIVAAEAQLSIYTNIGQKVFPDVLKASLNLATFMNTDAVSAARTLGRAFEDIAGGSLSLLARQRLLTAEQKEMAQKMAEGGDAAGAQAYVLGILQTKIGNLSADMAGTFAGRMEIFKNALGDIADDAGRKLMPALEPLASKLLELTEKIAPPLVDWIGNKVVPVLTTFAEGIGKVVDMLGLLSEGKISLTQIFESLLAYGKADIGSLFYKMFGNIDFGKIDWRGAFSKFADFASTLQKQIFSFFSNIDWRQLSQDVAAGINSIDWGAVGKTIHDGLATLFKADKEGQNLFFELLKNIVTKVDWGALLGAVGNGFASFIAGLLGGNWESIKANWSDNWNQLKEIVSKVWSNITSATESSLGKFGGSISSGLQGTLKAVGTWVAGFVAPIGAAFLNVTSAVGRWAGGFVSAIGNTLNDAVNAVLGFVGQFVTAGENLINGIIQGVQSAAGGLISALTGAVQNALNAAKKALGIQSPSTVMAGVGQNIIQGIIQGLAGAGGGIAAAVNALIGPIVSQVMQLPARIAPALDLLKKEFFNYFQQAMQQAVQAIEFMIPTVVYVIRRAVLEIQAQIPPIVIPVTLGSIPGYSGSIPGLPGTGTGTTGGGGGGSGHVRAKGGDVRAGEAYLVGEEGPEIIVPRQPGYVIPNSQIRGAQTVRNTYNIYGPCILNPDGSAPQAINSLFPLRRS